MTFEPSKYQKAIFDWVNKTQTGNLVVEALAGSGKTTTGVEVFKLLDKDLSSIFVAFNKHIAIELQHKLPPNAMARTYHSLGFQAVRDNLGNVDMDGKKTNKILEDIMPRKDNYWKYPTIQKLVSLVKANLTDTNPLTLKNLAEYYSIDLNNGLDPDEIFDAVDYVVEESKIRINMVDFDDMCWLPIILDLPCQKYDFLFVDELQDTNSVQTELVLKSIADDGRIIGVGDSKQSIYAFRGADSDAMDKFTARTNADKLPLSITYRNPKSVVNLVTTTFPEIPLEYPEWAIDGEIKYTDSRSMVDQFIDGDMVLCRVNADLVRPCFALIREGKKATIRGRDIGKNLQTIIKKMRVRDGSINTLMMRLSEYEMRETSKLESAERYAQASLLEDKIATIIAISDGCYDIPDLNAKIESTFSDEVEGVIFSSIHKAKGLEANNIYLLRPDLLPHPMAVKSGQSWALQQERNLEYVAYTRTLQTLSIVM